MRPVCVLGAAALAAALAVSGPAAADTDAEPPQRVRTGVQILVFLGVHFALLYLSAPPTADPPGNVRLIDKLRLRAWSFDASAFATNFVSHPLAGTFFYTTARSNRSGPLESLAWASLASLTWELAEFPENVSLNDLIVTPVAGASIGESFVQLSQWLDRRPRSAGRTALATVLFPMKLVNGAPPDDETDGALTGSLRLVAGATLHGESELGVQLATRLVHFPGFGAPGEGVRMGFAGNLSELSLDTRASRSGLADLRFTAGAALATVYGRSIAAWRDGWDLLATGGVAYDVRQHRWDAGPLDAWSSVHVPGVSMQLRRMAGPLRISARADLALTFAGARSFALDGGPATLSIITLTTTQQAWGYTMGWGVAAAPALEVAYGPFSLAFAGTIDTRYSLDRPDPWPDRHPTARIIDSWSSLRAGASIKLPWSDLEISASLQRSLRRGSAGALTRTAGETTALVAIGFALE